MGKKDKKKSKKANVGEEEEVVGEDNQESPVDGKDEAQTFDEQTAEESQPINDKGSNLISKRHRREKGSLR